MPKKKQHKNKPLLPVFHIFCEGEKTEPYYLNGFINEYFSSKRNILVIEKTKNNKPHTLIDEAILEKKKCGSNDVIWVVYDRESKSSYSDDLHKAAKKKADKNDIKVAFSSVCFEQWILFHFGQSTKAYGSYRELKRISNLKSNLSSIGIDNYDKSLPELFDHLKSSLDQAINNSKKVNQISKSNAVSGKSECYYLNPYSNVYELLEDIEDFCKKY